MEDRASRARYWLPAPTASEALLLARELEEVRPWWPGSTLLRGLVALECEEWSEAADAFDKARPFGFAEAEIGAHLARRQVGLATGDGGLPGRLRLRWRLRRRMPRPSHGGSKRLTERRRSVVAWRVLAFWRIGLKRRAIARAWELVEERPTRWESWALFAQMAIDRGRPDEAAEALNRAAALGAGLQEARSQVRVLLTLRRHDEAIAVGRRAMPAWGDAPLLFGIGAAHAATGNWHASAEAFARGNALAPDSVEGACGAVRANMHLGLTGAAREGASLALERWPDRADVRDLAATVASADHQDEIADRYAARLPFEAHLDRVAAESDVLAIASLARNVPPLPRVRREIRRFARERYSPSSSETTRLDDLLATTPDLADRLRARVDRARWRRAHVYGLGQFLEWLLAGVAVMSMLVLIALAPAFGLGEDLGITLRLAIGLVQFVLVAFTFSAFIWFSEAFDDARYGLVAFVLLMVLSTGIIAWLRDGDRPAIALLLLFIVFTAYVLLAAGVAAVLSMGWTTILERRCSRADPWAACLGALLSALAGVERLRAQRTADEERVTEDIETAARTLQLTMRRTMDRHDGTTDVWFAQRIAGHVSALRSLKGWVVSPGPESLGALEERLGQDIRAVARRQWRELEWVDPEPLAASRRRLVSMMVIRNLVIGAAPAVGLFVVESLGLVELGDTVRDQAFLAALVWAAVTLLTTLDPEFSSRLGAVRESITTMRSIRGRRE
jgi:tetratricopeptide (TPR) repeat protein